VALLGVVVVLGDLGPELDLPDVDLLLVLARGLLLLLLLVFVFRVVEHARDRRPRVGRHLHQVEVALARVVERLVGLDHANLVAVLADEPHLRDANPLVDPGEVPLGRTPVESPGDRH
jgi:hypothetical protein